MENVATALSHLGERLPAPEPADANGALSTRLNEALAALPQVRSLVLLGPDGRVEGSTRAADLGQRIDLNGLKVALPDPGRDVLGAYLPGRDLSDALGAGRGATVPAEIGFVPLIRALGAAGGEMRYLVALLNPDSLTSVQLLNRASGDGSVFVLSYGGQVLAASGERAATPGAAYDAHAAIASRLPAQTFAAFRHDAAPGGSLVTAYRLSRSRPLLAVVEHPLRETRARWQRSIRGYALLALLLTGCFGFAMVAALRALRAREKARAELAAVQAQAMQREQDLSALVEGVQALLFRTDAAGVLTFVNDRWISLRGEPPTQARGVALARLVAQQDRPAVLALFDASRRDGVRTVSAELRAVNGVARHLDFTVVPQVEDGVLVGYAGSAVDETDRMLTERALQRQLKLTSLILDISPVPIATMDAQGRYLSVNRAWEEFWGISRLDLVAKPAYAHLGASDAALHAARDRELWLMGGSVRYEAKVPHQDGSRRDVVLTHVLIPGEQGHAPGKLVTMVDVTDFREAERAMAAAREAASNSERTRHEFLGNMTHELRTPLQTIIGFSEQGVTRGGQSPKLQSMFREIHAAGTRMLALVNDLLDLSKIESPVGAITLERLELRTLVRQVLVEFEPMLAERRLHVDVNLGEEPLIAKVDPTRMQQVVRNVMANAVKFAPAGSMIDVRARISSERRIVVTIRDHGPGIPQDEIEAIFEAFVQSTATKDGSGGTGLGLAICRKIMQAFEGSIVARNARGGGAVFRIELPARHRLDRDTDFGEAPVA